jgi:hypothetical protein
MFAKVNLREALDNKKKQSERAEDQLIENINNWFIADWEREQKIAENIGHEAVSAYLPDGDKLDHAGIYNLADIKALCVSYRLRFLSSKLFKGDIPREALVNVRKVEAQLGNEVKAFMIVAPAPMFRLEDVNTDPLLFIPLNDGKYYLVHQWGNDMAWYRKLLVWPLASLRNLVMFIIASSIALSSVIPTSLIGSSFGYFNFYRGAIMVWFIIFLSGMISYFWFATGQKFSVNAWRSKHFN